MTLTIKLVRHGQSAANVGLVNSWEVGDHSIELTVVGEHPNSRSRLTVLLVGSGNSGAWIPESLATWR